MTKIRVGGDHRTYRSCNNRSLSRAITPDRTNGTTTFFKKKGTRKIEQIRSTEIFYYRCYVVHKRDSTAPPPPPPLCVCPASDNKLDVGHGAAATKTHEMYTCGSGPIAHSGHSAYSYTSTTQVVSAPSQLDLPRRSKPQAPPRIWA